VHSRVILAIARKDALDALINRTTLTVLLAPILIAVLFVILTQVFGTRTDDILVYNPGGSGVVQVVSGAFANTKVVTAASADDVAAAFGSDGSHKSSTYTAGLVVPADFEASLRASGHPQVTLFTNGDDVSAQQRQLLIQALSDYSRAVAAPQAPASINTVTINPPSTSPVADLGPFYAAVALLTSFMVGTLLMPGLLVEEKEKKTLRMLMVSSASWGDIIAGKLLIGLGYQLILAAVALAVTKGYVGQVPLVLLFALLGSCFSLILGLLLGSLLKTTSAAGAGGLFSFMYIIPIFFTGVLGNLFSNNAASQVIRFVPTFYLADGIVNAMQNRTASGALALDIAVIVGCIIALFIAAVWALRRQAAVTAAI
jgi:ABC-2 type transport system permease protein